MGPVLSMIVSAFPGVHALNRLLFHIVESVDTSFYFSFLLQVTLVALSVQLQIKVHSASIEVMIFFKLLKLNA